MNIANLITSIRLIVLPFIIYALAYGKSTLALALLALALISDLIDGLIARRFGQTTVLGEVLDPVADKALFLSLFGFYTWVGEIPLIAFFLLLLPYSALIVGGGVLYTQEGEVISANAWGKTSSALITLGLIAVFFDLPYSLYFIYLGIATAYASAVVYFTMGTRRQGSWTRSNQ